MARLRSTSDAYAHQGLPPAQILDELNRFAAHQIRGEFATAFVAIFDPKRNSLTYGSAGHLPALLRRAQTGDVLRLSNASGPMIGPFADSIYLPARRQIRDRSPRLTSSRRDRRSARPGAVAAVHRAEAKARTQSSQAPMPSPVRALTGRTAADGLTSRTRAI